MRTAIPFAIFSVAFVVGLVASFLWAIQQVPS